MSRQQDQAGSHRILRALHRVAEMVETVPALTRLRSYNNDWDCVDRFHALGLRCRPRSGVGTDGPSSLGHSAELLDCRPLLQWRTPPPPDSVTVIQIVVTVTRITRWLTMARLRKCDTRRDN